MTDAQLPLRLDVPARRRRGKPAPAPGTVCKNERGQTHRIAAPGDDGELQSVLAWLRAQDGLPERIGDAIEDAIYYVLDGWRTYRFDFLDERVDSDERRSLGTKLQYHVIESLELEKKKHPDTEICGVGVEIKGTIRSNWAIPTEGQCGVTMLHRVDVEKGRHKTWLMRAHRAWLNDGMNKDGKRGIRVQALEDYAIPLYEWHNLRPNPLSLLTEAQQAVVFGEAGQQERLKALFNDLPEVVIPRAVILTVCANRTDPIRRVRAIRPQMRRQGLALLCGQWVAQREIAGRLGYDLTGAAWVAVPWSAFMGFGAWTRAALEQMDPTHRWAYQ
ncbi:NaeI family type II restriction endonuclease [Kribbella sp. NBC_00889]|uniref:NaeI family type II restriction endonuclease n=1 Tax=Kribbella sp. NBC_00889 TaxID=2975974 RepID=UPI0038650A0A|nr:hypothetical protein OG817_00080 [Kribbella sp. NBC_00889]